VEWYLEEHGHKERAQVFQREGLALVEQAAHGALANAGLSAQDIDAVVLVSTTGLATPSLDARVMNRIPFRRDLRRVPVWGLGCAGGVGGINRAVDLAAGSPRGHVLLVCVELCSLLFDIQKAVRRDAAGPDKKAVIAASLFADGAAGLVVSGDDTGAKGVRHVAGASHLFPDTERVMGWDVEDHNLDVVLSPRIPDIVREHAPGLVQGFLTKHNQGAAPDHWVLHPGGAKVIDAYRDALGLSPQELAYTDGVLRAYGNMSSATALFALQDAQRRMARGETALMSALGPGFASELALVRA
jgi:alkylresorcinol/alkylpyrone synthase